MVYTADLSPAGYGYESSSLSIGTKLLPLTLNGRGLGLELSDVSSILTGVAKFYVSMVKWVDALDFDSGASSG